ncbi:Mitochondrial inner membrane protease atp23 [Claviceps sp. LM220 group G6]|nr:Mitochondrial inner membrane protease atp23 [Claviceps sp. LM218 group G6]KAG6099079.1 Mitochondrial inner membrane protease atp23 [Claviceps sp. LM220 group G6]KAG6112997.1 Mitochondrial inner membrane protease atp23 [Claviceps sp. LM219 group G6]
MASSSAPPSASKANAPSDISANANANANAAAKAKLFNPPKELVNDPARTGFDPETKWWMHYFGILSGQMTKEGQFHFQEWRDKQQEESDCKRCEKNLKWLFNYSPVIRFLSDRIQDLNGKLDESNIFCRRCPSRLHENGSVSRQAGGFDPNYGILICANEMRDRGHLEDTVAHEMMHAWDHLRWKVDWTGDKDLKHAACTEIRASMLSGECRWRREAFTRGQWTVTQQFQDCVRRRAVQSVMGRPWCKGRDHATKAVDGVWDSCFADTRPFDEIFR